MIFGVQRSEIILLSSECQHTVAGPVKVENPARRAASFSTTIRSPLRRTAEFCGFAGVEVVEVRKLGLSWNLSTLAVFECFPRARHRPISGEHYLLIASA